MGGDASLAPGIRGNETDIPDDLALIYPEQVQENIQQQVFTSSLVTQNPRDVERPFEWPDVNFIVDIITNPGVMTRYKTPTEALYRVIFPLFTGKDSTKPFLHQLLFQYFEFAKTQYSQYHKLHKLQHESYTKLRHEECLKIHKAHREAQIHAVNPNETRNLDQKMVYDRIIAGFASNRLDLLVSVIPFLVCHDSEPFLFSFTGISAPSLMNIAFTPVMTEKTRIAHLLNFATNNPSIASNGRYLYLSEARGAISVYLKGVCIQHIRISNRDIVFAASEEFLYVTDWETEYVCSAYPVRILHQNSKIQVHKPFCSDGKIVYSFAKNKLTGVTIDGIGSIKVVKTIEFREKVDAELLNRAILYCSGPIITIMKEIGDNKYTVRHWSTENGQYIGYSQFTAQIPIHAISFDPFNRCFFATSVFQRSTKVFMFPYFGSLPNWITGIDIPCVAITASICRRFESVRFCKDLLSALLEFLKFYAVHVSGMSFEEMLTNPHYTPEFGNFMTSVSPEFMTEELSMILPAFLRFSKAEHYKSLDLSKPVLFQLMNSYSLRRNVSREEAQAVFERVFRESDSFKLFVIKNNHHLPFFFSPEFCTSIFTPIFERLVAGKETSRLELELVDIFQPQVMKRKRYKKQKATFHAYTKVVFDSFSMLLTREKQTLSIFEKFLFLLKPVLKYSLASVEIYPRLLEFFKTLHRNNERILSTKCLLMFRVLFLYLNCIESILKGGKELRVQFVNDILKREQTIPDLVFQNDAKVDELYCKVFSTAIKRLGNRLTPLEKQIERTVMAVTMKQHNAYDDFREFIESGKLSHTLQEVVRLVGVTRQKLRNLVQNCDSVASVEQELLRKAQFLMKVELKENFRVSSFLTSEYSLDQILVFLDDAEKARMNVTHGYAALTQLMNLDQNYGTSAITYLLKIRFWEKLVSSEHAQSAQIGLMKKIHPLISESTPLFVFYCIMTMSFTKMTYFLAVLKDVSSREIPKPLLILMLSVLYLKKHDREELTKSELPQIDEIRDILFENRHNFSSRDIPMLRLALRSGIVIPLSFTQLMNIFRTSNETYMHGIVELAGDVIDQAPDQMDIFDWILTEIGVIATGKQGFFCNSPVHLQLSICDQLIELIRKFVTKDPCHTMFISILSNTTKKEHIVAVFAVLSESFDTFHSHFLMRDTLKNTTNYIIDTTNNTIKYYPLPFDPHSVPREEKNSKQIQPISEIEFSVELFPERELLIPYYVRALNAQHVDILNYYVLQSLKVFVDDKAFLEQFLSSQTVLSLEKFSFVDFSRHFLRILEFGFNHTVIPANESLFSLCSSEALTVTDTELKCTTGKHTVYSPILNSGNVVTLTLLEPHGNITFGMHSLSFFNYTTSRYIFNTLTNEITYNNIVIKTMNQAPTTLSFDSKSNTLTFDDFEVHVRNESFCFIFELEGSASVKYTVTGLFETKHTFQSVIPYFCLTEETKHHSLFTYPREFTELLSDSLDFSLMPFPAECSSVPTTRTINTSFTKITQSEKLSAEIQLLYIFQILASIQCEISSKILMKSIENDSYTNNRFALNHTQLLDFAMSLLTLIEPISLDYQLVNFGSDIFATRSPELAFQCVEKIIKMMDTVETTRLWFSLLRDKMNTLKYHFIDTENPNVIVLTKSPCQTITIPRAKGFILMKGGFSHGISELAVIDDHISLSTNIVIIRKQSITVTNNSEIPVICIPIYSNANTSLFDSFLELAITFKYFVLFLKKQKELLPKNEHQKLKTRCYKFFFNSVNFESPFFYSYSDEIQEFLADNLPLTARDLDQKMAQTVSTLAAYSGNKPRIAALLSKIEALWNDKALIPLISHFPEFISDTDFAESEQPFLLPPSPFDKELHAGEDHTQLIQIIKPILLSKSIIGFPFQYIITMWCSEASKYPQFHRKKLDDRTLEIEFDFFRPKSFEFHFNKKMFSLSHIGDNRFRANTSIPDDLKFYISSKEAPQPEDFVMQFRCAFVRDVTTLVENWDHSYDHKIMKRFPEKVLRGNKLKPNLTPDLFMQSKLNLPYHLITLRGRLLLTTNWLFLRDTNTLAFTKLFDFIHRGTRLDMFMNLIQKYVPYRVTISVNRLAALENRNGTRPHLTNSFISQIANSYSDHTDLRSQWKVTWMSESGEDGGGPGRELITEAATDIFSPNTGLFIEFNKDTFIPVSSDQLENPSKLYKIVGVILGMIIRNCVVQRFPVPPFFWRFICTDEFTINDIYSLDEAYKSEIEGLSMLSQADFETRFSEKKFVERDFKGKEVQMKEGIVTFNRIQEFILMSNQFKLSLLKQNLENIRNGLFESLGVTSLPRFVTPDLLEFTVCGFPKISAKAMMKAVKFREVTTSVKQMFTRIVIELSSEQRSQLLRFVTGRIRLPKLDEGETLFTVDMALHVDDKLPSASTCFCQLHLPKYSSYEIAKRQIITAIENTQTFENL